MFDPISLTGIAVLGSKIANHNRCPVCKNVKMLATWMSWTCCNVDQCPDCAAKTKHSKSCRNCGHKVQ